MDHQTLPLRYSIRLLLHAANFTFLSVACFCNFLVPGVGVDRSTMIFEDSRQGSTFPERGCARLESPLPDLKVNGKVESKILRRKRMDLRRVRLDESNQDRLLFENDFKKSRSEVWKAQVEDALLVRLPEISAGVGRSGEEMTASCDNHGSISVIGRRREMEDAIAVKLGFLTRGETSYDFFGVYDGHGGRRVAETCSETLHKLLASVVEDRRAGEEEVDWRKAMVAGFKKMDEEVNKIGAAVATVGSTAVVAVIGVNEVVMANCGDSRAVLCRGGVAIQLSDDHKPDRPDELARIEGLGGLVIDWNGQRVLGVLATSRSIGDEYLKPYITSEPEVSIMSRSDEDEFIILASDGLWDVVSNDLACQVVRRCLEGRRHLNGSVKIDGKLTAKASAATLSELAIARGSKDNISVIVIGLNFDK